MFEKQRARDRAFTIVELLVVVAIIAALVAMLLPALTRARQAAVRVQCASNLRQIGISAHSYAAENRGWFPLYGFSGYTFFSFGNGGWWDTDSGSPSYKGGIAMLGRQTEMGQQLKPYIADYRIFFDPGFHPGIDQGISSYLDQTFRGTIVDSPFTEYLFFNGNRPGTSVNPMPGYDPKKFAGKVNAKPDTVIGVDRNLMIGSKWVVNITDGMGMNYMAHKEGMNALYCDGHVSFYSSSNGGTGFQFVPANNFYPGGSIAYTSK
ncbi:MAG TPA: DUF1559 domain-containing protein [Roseimicrobium sp.]|nr:DUF1559 domain-containing protein [Roseimicrobium sp.]